MSKERQFLATSTGKACQETAGGYAEASGSENFNSLTATRSEIYKKMYGFDYPPMEEKTGTGGTDNVPNVKYVR